MLSTNPAIRLPAMHFPPTAHQLGLYPVVDSVAWLAKLLPLGIKTIQLRIKNRQPAKVEADIMQAILLGKQYQARLFINDYWQLAIKHHAYGVHLGQEDIQTADLSAIAEAKLRLGISTHCDREIDNILAIHPSYIALGHIFPTQTKQMPSKPQGLIALAEQVKKLQQIPTVAIGGISIDRAEAVLKTGVGSIAVVSAITKAVDWRQATLQLQKLVSQYLPQERHQKLPQDHE
ncbi:thiamine phosphate synthase [Orbaceae bacterium ESL0727]|nr:thiamine phosphate synthase [Orbaceae bacterium ESL0727]